ncbi:MAG: formylglycine-generating enzyme family protein, partial [Desulfobacteraceae bacterium]|nr:formylglycine-generating enzyme family protein [Desulfobacteraceae bacterium]
MVTDFITRMLLQSGKTLKLPELADSNPFIKHFSIAPDITAEFAYIPPGTFIMGSPEDEPGRRDNEKQHQVTITKGFYMQTTQVTQGQWKAVMGNNPSYFQSGDDYPVENVSWNGVQEFIKKLNEKEGAAYRLPTEA